MTFFWVAPLNPQYKEIEPQGHKRSLAAHIACVGVKYYFNYFGSLIFLDLDFFLVNNSWVPFPPPNTKKMSLKATTDLLRAIES